MRPITVLDPGHGGTVSIGRSTPFGVRAPNGMLEKSVTLALARRAAARLGQSVRLTRNGDVNLSLGDRARVARDLGAPAFLSIHASGEMHGGRGCEAWIHSHAGADSLALADEVRGELTRLGLRDRGVHRGDLAVITPSLHAPGCAACLIEVEHLDGEGARRFGDPRQLDAMADGLARALERVLARGARLGQRTYSFGRGAAHILEDELDLTDFPTNVFVVIPDGSTPSVPREIRQSDHDALQRAWDCMMRSRGLTIQGADDHQRRWRELLRGGLADSPLIRGLFQEIACDESHPLTIHVGEHQDGVFVDGFQFDPTLGSIAAGLRQAGHHTVDLADFAVMPRVSGNPRNHMMLMHQNLVHTLREARQGTLGDTYPPSHERAIDDENLFRQEQGQIGSLDHHQPSPGAGGDLIWDFTDSAGTVVVSESWHVSGRELTSIDYSP